MTDTELETAIRKALHERTRHIEQILIPPFANAVLESEPRTSLDAGGRRRRTGVVLAIAGVAIAVTAAFVVQISHTDSQHPSRAVVLRTP
jgi:hypothetical protein